MTKTTDNQNEVFAVVDENDRVVGEATRREVHKDKNLIHRSVGVAVFNSKGELFMQQRSHTKDTEPLKWTISCSGHVDKGDSYEQTAVRELKEELGLDERLEIETVGKFLFRAPYESEMVMLFKTVFEGPFRLHPEEIRQGKFFTQKELIGMLRRGEMELSFIGGKSLEKLGWVFPLYKKDKEE
ncbi:NUDIX domain-containing protein [Patescibacteria group bacterium]|nr:NUDIX domain-containing protein [Patescibacteria group bacterium]